MFVFLDLGVSCLFFMIFHEWFCLMFAFLDLSEVDGAGSSRDNVL